MMVTGEKARDLSTILSDNTVFRDMSDDHRRTLAGCAVLSSYDAGDLLYREGQDADSFFLIRHGRVALEVHLPNAPAIIVSTAREGEPVGWSWMIPPYRTSFDARALELTRVVKIDAICLRSKMEADPALGYEIFKRMTPVIAARLAATRRQMIDQFGRPKDLASWR